MASQRQIAANRLNAQASTGPRTAEGKAASSRNALTHGLTARTLLLEGEDPQEYRWLRQGVIHDYRPATTLERELVEQIVSVLWRMRRVPAVEAALTAWLEAVERESDRRCPKLAPRKRHDGQTLAGTDGTGAIELRPYGQAQPPRGRPAAAVVGPCEGAARAAGAPARCGPTRKRAGKPACPPGGSSVPFPAAFSVVAGSEANGSPSTAVTQAKP